MENTSLVKVLLNVPQCDLERFDEVASSKRMTRSALMRECVLEKIAEHKSKEA